MEQMDVDFRTCSRNHAQAAAATADPHPRSPPYPLEQETEALIDRQVVAERRSSWWRTREIFIDELDKNLRAAVIACPDVSRQGVQRDLLPVVEGTTVNTRTARCGPTTSCSSPPGRSTYPKPSDLMPELQAASRSGSS